MIIRMMYVLPMLLGRTYDVKRNAVGVDIFPTTDTENPRVVVESFYRSSYKTVESSSDVRELLDINGDLSLCIKAGALKASGIGAYVKGANNAQDSVDILVKVAFRTVSHSLPHSARPVADWSASFRPEYLGTHFVQSVLYGGDLIGRIRFRAVKKEDLQRIRAQVKASLAGGSALDLMGEGTLESLDKQLSNKARMEIDYFATVPLEGVPNTIGGLRALVRGFEEHVRKVNGGLGVPVEVELRELATFDQKFDYVKNLEMETELEFFEEYFDDLLSTKSRMKALIYEYPNELGKEELKQLSELGNRIGSILRVFYSVISKLDLSRDSEQLDVAKDAYREGKGLGMAGKFRRELNKILNKINSNLVFDQEYSSVFHLFGSSTCEDKGDDKSVLLLYPGRTATSPRNQIGSGQDALCMPLQTPPDDNSTQVVGAGRGGVAGVKFGLMPSAPFRVGPDKAMNGVACAVCLARRQTVATFYGRSVCGADWKTLSSGYMMSPSDVERSESLCVDKGMTALRDAAPGKNDPSLNFVQLTQGKFVPCVICAK